MHPKGTSFGAHFFLYLPSRSLDDFQRPTALLQVEPQERKRNLKRGRKIIAVKLKAGEVVWFSWFVYKSRKHRDNVNVKVMKDPRLASMMDPKALPFDGKRMFWGGFKVAVEA